jgi:MFS family permease
MLHHLRARTFRALGTRNYRLYFAGQATSAAGTWVQLVAENWLVVQLGGSGTALGITTVLQFAPLLLLGAWGGVPVDRWDKRALLTATQTAAGLLALATGLLALSGLVRIWMIWLAALLLGCVNALDNPGQQAFTMELAGPADVTNAGALNNAVATAARAVGPAIGGLLLSTLGVAPCFLLNAASYAAVVLALRAIDPGALHREAPAPRGRGQLCAGLQHAWRTPALRAVLLVLALVSALGFNFQILLALLAARTFAGGGALYGLFLAALGVGAVLGSLAAASGGAPTVRRVGALALAHGAALAAVAGARGLPPAFAAVTLTGATFSLFLVACAGRLQLHAGAGLRGRVMALYTIAFLGVAPVGGPLVGGVAQLLGPRAGFLLGAAGCAAAGGAALLASARRAGRPA